MCANLGLPPAGSCFPPVGKLISATDVDPSHRQTFRCHKREVLGSAACAVFLVCVTAVLSGCGSFISVAAGPGGKSIPTTDPAAATLGLPSALYCDSQTFTGAGVDSCTVTLTASSSTAQVVTLSSDNSAVTLPASVTIPANSASANFTVRVVAVSSNQTATITATAQGISKPYTLRLTASVTNNAPALALSANSVGFGTVSLNTAAAPASVTLTSSGNAALTISGISISGTGFTVSGASVPATLNPGQSMAISVGFDPATAGNFTGTVTINSNASTGETVTISLTGTGASGSSGGSGSGGSGSGGGSGNNTQAALTSPAPGSVLHGSSTAFIWTAGSGITEYQLWVGTAGVGSGDLGIDSVSATGASTLSATVAGIPTAGAKVYVRLYTYSSAGGGWKWVDYVYTEASGQTSGTATLGSVSCTSVAVSGAGTDACTVSLTAAAPSGGARVSLSSNNTAVTVPATVTIAAGATTASFSAVYSTVTSAHAVTLTASFGGISTTFVLQLNVTAASLGVSTSSIAFGNVDLNTPATQSVTLTSTGTATLTINTGAVSGKGFSIAGVTFPASLSSGKTATLHVQFDPTVAGAATGLVTLTTNGSPGLATIALTGTGQSAAGYQVDLTWDAPGTSTDPVAGYNIYRAAGSSLFTLLNSSADSVTNYTDSSVASGSSYEYEVTSVDKNGVESLPSNVFSVSIP